VRGVLTGIALLGLILAACGAAQSVPPFSTATTGAPVAPAGPKSYSAPPAMAIDVNKQYVAVIRTNFGDLTFELLPGDAPVATNNFVALARDGYYTNVGFHRIIPTFMAQSGDPTGTGTGGPGYSFAIEPPKRPYVRGSLAMANKGIPNSNGAQFFIAFDRLSELGRLSPDYTLFGQMIDGEATLAKIEAVKVGPSASGETSKPLEDVRILTVEIRER